MIPLPCACCFLHLEAIEHHPLQRQARTRTCPGALYWPRHVYACATLARPAGARPASARRLLRGLSLLIYMDTYTDAERFSTHGTLKRQHAAGHTSCGCRGQPSGENEQGVGAACNGHTTQSLQTVKWANEAERAHRRTSGQTLCGGPHCPADMYRGSELLLAVGQTHLVTTKARLRQRSDVTTIALA